jgi:hypothetical protein
MRSRGQIATALVLIALGGWFLALEIWPAMRALAYGRETWPLNILGVGAVLGLVGLLSWTPGLIIPACIAGGIGGLLYWQNLTGDWESWAYAWTLMPGFVGAGLLLSGLMERRRGALAAAAWLLVISAVLFGVFGSFLGDNPLVGQVWPAVLILAGAVLLVRPLLQRKRG